MRRAVAAEMEKSLKTGIKEIFRMKKKKLGWEIYAKGFIEITSTLKLYKARWSSGQPPPPQPY